VFVRSCWNESEARNVEYLMMFLRRVPGLVLPGSLILFIVCLKSAGNAVPELLVTRGRCHNQLFLFLVSPFKWARGIDRLDEDEFNAGRLAVEGNALNATLWLTAQMVLTAALSPIIIPCALIVRIAYAFKRLF